MGHLHTFCAKHDIDTHEIDSSLTYPEAKSHLVSLSVPGELEFQPELCEEIQEVNDKLSFEEQVKEFLAQPIEKEKTPEESYQELLDEFGYTQKLIEDKHIKEQMIKNLVIKIQKEEGSWKTRLRRKINFLNSIIG